MDKKDKKLKASILGAGSFGSSVTNIFSSLDYETYLYARDEKKLENMIKTRKNEHYLKGFEFDKEIKFTSNLEEAIKDADILVIAVSAQNTRSLYKNIKSYINEQTIVVNLAKGIEISTGLRMSNVYEEEIGLDNYVCLSGPSHAEEVAQKIPTTIVASSKDKGLSKKVQNMMSTNYFRIYTNDDLTGVELGGALKNIIAIGSGILDGVGYGDNSKAALITRGLHEITKLGVKLGSNKDTFSGLSGVGDLVVTCMSINSRNFRFGRLIGQGINLEQAKEQIGMVAEGVPTCKATYEIAQKLDISMPITTGIYGVLYENKDPKIVIKELMNRNMKPETYEQELYS